MIDKEIIMQSLDRLKLDEIKLVNTNQKFKIWDSKKIKELNTNNNVDEFAPKLMGIGSSDREMLTVQLDTGIVYSIPFIPLNSTKKNVIAENIDSLVELA
ncbi:MAG: hypothetical protein ACJAZ2_001834 [Glaciecola sp.]|jgi:hypothetical protein